MRRSRSWVLSAIIVVIFGIMLLRSGGQVPLPDNYQKISDSEIRIPVKMQAIPARSAGEAWNLTRHADKTYYVNMYLNGRQKRNFGQRGVIRRDAAGTTYQTAGLIQFGNDKYHATDMFVAKDGQSGYIDFVKNTSANSTTGHS